MVDAYNECGSNGLHNALATIRRSDARHPHSFLSFHPSQTGLCACSTFPSTGSILQSLLSTLTAGLSEKYNLSHSTPPKHEMSIPTISSRTPGEVELVRLMFIMGALSVVPDFFLAASFPKVTSADASLRIARAR